MHVRGVDVPWALKILIMRRIVKKEQKEKGEKVKRRKNMHKFSKLPPRRLQEVKGKTLMPWHVKVIHNNVNKLFRASNQNKFSKSSHSIWTQCAQLFVRTLDLHLHVEEHMINLLMLRNT